MAIVTETITAHPTSYDTTNVSYEVLSTQYPIENAYTYASSTSYCNVSWKKGSGSETYFYLKFDFSSIPENATITSITASAKGYVNNTNTSRVAVRRMQFFSGTTAKGEYHGISNSATEYSIDVGDWTRAELQDARIRYYVKRGTNSSYYNSDYYLRMYGATMTVTYQYDDSPAPAIPIRVKQNGSWVTPTKVLVKDNGSWTEATKILVKDNGTWK